MLFEVVDGEARVVLGTFLRAEDRGNAARDEPLHELGVRAVRRRAFGGVKDAETARGARAEVEETAAIFEALARRINGPGNLRQDLLNGRGDLAVLLLHDRDHLERRAAVDMSGGRVAALRRES